MSHANDEIRRQLGGMPTGENNLADMSFSVRRVEPVEEEPSTVLELWGMSTVRSPEYLAAQQSRNERYRRMLDDLGDL